MCICGFVHLSAVTCISQVSDTLAGVTGKSLDMGAEDPTTASVHFETWSQFVDQIGVELTVYSSGWHETCSNPLTGTEH